VLNNTKAVANPFYDIFIDLCSGSKKSIKLCAPFVKTSVIDDILAKKNSSVPFTLITKVDLKNFHNKSSDIKALKKVIENDGKVFNCSILHAKIYIFDDECCVITSANLSYSGFNVNAEFGVLSKDQSLVVPSIKYYKTMQTYETKGELTVSKLDDILLLLSNIKPLSHVEYPKLDLTVDGDINSIAIANGLSGWKQDVFIALGQLKDTFDSSVISKMAAQLRTIHPKNNHPEEKIRQVLQQLRDLGLVEFTSPGVYKKLWT
jgi:hypothetical protein